MTQMRSVQENLHSDIAALDTRFDDLPSSDQFEQLEARQQQLLQSLNTFSSTFTGFFDHFYSIYPAPMPPPEFYPHQPFYPLPPPPMDDWASWQLMPKGEKTAWSATCMDLGGAHGSHGVFIRFAFVCYSWFSCDELYYVALHVYHVVLHELWDLWLNLMNLVCNLWWTMLACKIPYLCDHSCGMLRLC